MYALSQRIFFFHTASSYAALISIVFRNLAEDAGNPPVSPLTNNNPPRQIVKVLFNQLSRPALDGVIHRAGHGKRHAVQPLQRKAAPGQIRLCQGLRPGQIAVQAGGQAAGVLLQIVQGPPGRSGPGRWFRAINSRTESGADR